MFEFLRSDSIKQALGNQNRVQHSKIFLAVDNSRNSLSKHQGFNLFSEKFLVKSSKILKGQKNLFRLSLSLREKSDFFLKTMLTIDFGAEVHGCDHRVECRQSPSVVHVVGQRCILL